MSGNINIALLIAFEIACIEVGWRAATNERPLVPAMAALISGIALLVVVTDA